MRLPLPILVLAWIAGCTTGCGGNTMTVADATNVSIETFQQEECVRMYAPDASAQNDCRALIRAQWDRYWSGQWDGGAQ